MHAFEKILARAAGQDTVSTGQIVNCRVDLAEVNDLYPQTIFSFFEMGAKCAYIQPDEITLEFIKNKVNRDYAPVETDPDFQYVEELFYDVSHIKPQLAAPDSVDNGRPLSDLIGTPVNQAYLGSCTGGRLEDIAVAAKILKGQRINKATRFVVVPASQQVYLEALRKGDVETLIKARATFVTPGCAACLGTHEGILASGEVCLASTNRNFPGRMGHTTAAIYLRSPAAAAAAALSPW